MAYQVGVYRTSGGDELVVDSSGVIAVHSGGEINVASGGEINVASGGEINLAAGGSIVNTVTATTGGDTLPAYGISRVRSTGGNVVYYIEPVAGVRKFLYCDSTGVAIVTTTGTFDGTNKNLLFSTGGTNIQKIELIGISTDRWLILTTGYSTDITLTNT